MKNIRKTYKLEQNELTNRFGIFLTTLPDIAIGKSRPGYDLLFNSAFLGLNLTCFLYGWSVAFPQNPYIYSKGRKPYEEYSLDTEELFTFMSNSWSALSWIMEILGKYLYNMKSCLGKISKSLMTKRRGKMINTRLLTVEGILSVAMATGSNRTGNVNAKFLYTQGIS